MAMLEINNLQKSYHGFSLGPVNMQLEPGSVHGLVGGNGSGKTTMFCCVMGTILRDQGGVIINGNSADNESGYWKQSIGYVGDYTPLFESWSGANNLKVLSRYYENWSDEIVLILAKKFNLNLNQVASNYSTGQRTKLAIIAAFAHGAKLLLLDEPTSGMDPLARDIFTEILYEQMQNEELTILYATHYLSEIENLADQLILMDSGKIISHEMQEDLKNNWRKITFRSNNDISALPFQISKKTLHNDIEIITSNYQVTTNTLEQLGIESIQTSRLSIEQICVEFLKNEKGVSHD